jgi:transposase
MKNLKRPSQTESDAMSHPEKDALLLKLFDWLEELEERINRLENKIVKDSNNSSKPPSSDGLTKGAADPRKLGEKSNGGQKGHQGITRRMIESPDAIEVLYSVSLCDCGADLKEQVATLKERRQQIEIPESKAITTEYQQMQVHCRCGLKRCGHNQQT